MAFYPIEMCTNFGGQNGFGIVLLESMAVGKPVVASNIAGYASILTDGVEGILVPPKDDGKLARALISSPKLLILDEPNTFVDQSFEMNLYEILRELNKQMAIVMVSHDLGLIASQVKSIACLSNTLYYHDSGEITQELLDKYNCPIDLSTHGDIPHRVLKHHNQDHD